MCENDKLFVRKYSNQHYINFFIEKGRLSAVKEYWLNEGLTIKESMEKIDNIIHEYITSGRKNN